MTWDALIETLKADGLLAEGPYASRRIQLSGVAHDSRRVRPGNLFVALRGAKADGALYAQQAVDRGAVAVLAETPAPAGISVPWLVVGHARRAMALAAARCAGDPSADLRVVGITGTNGKTTTAYLVASIFEAAGIPCGLVGTVGYRIGRETRDAERTTPESTEVQALLKEMREAGCGACAMEVSSHALALDRVTGVTFAAGVYTNLTRDHLDFHEDMDAYFRAKRRLFEMLPSGAPGVINQDDPRAPQLIDVAARPVTYAINRTADVTPGPLAFALSGLTFDVRTPAGSVHVRSALVGRPNVYNILAAVATTTALGLPLNAIAEGVSSLRGVSGRFQVVSDPSDECTVVVDYAHTDDALRNVLETARPLTNGRLITVFGCGGDRDRSKRPLMGAVAGRLSDVIVITSDNPRSEDPIRIIEEIQRGLTAATRRGDDQPVRAIVDREEAIAAAIALARQGDLVLIAGKGHEKYQVTGDRSQPFDDVAVAVRALARRRAQPGVV